MGLEFYEDAKRNSARMIKRGLMTLGKPVPVAPKTVAKQVRRDKERLRIAASRKAEKLKPKL